jgi:hypothetical protein
VLRMKQVCECFLSLSEVVRVKVLESTPSIRKSAHARKRCRHALEQRQKGQGQDRTQGPVEGLVPLFGCLRERDEGGPRGCSLPGGASVRAPGASPPIDRSR